MSNTDVVLSEKTVQKVTEPPNWKVIFLNDDVTPMDFVISLLMEIFKHDEQSAYIVTMQVHESGSGVAGIYSHEIAEVKAIQATELSKQNGFPLQIKIEIDD